MEFTGQVKDNQIINIDYNEKQAAKGTKESVKQMHLRHTHYKKVLEELSTISVKQNVIKSKAHTIATYNQTRVALTAFDSKRWICDDNIHTYAFGHYKTLEEYQVDWDEPMTIDDSDNVNWDSDVDFL